MGLVLNDSTLPYFRPPSFTLADVGDFEGGEGIRVCLTRQVLVVEVATQGGGGDVCIPVTALLDALCRMSGGEA